MTFDEEFDNNSFEYGPIIGPYFNFGSQIFSEDKIFDENKDIFNLGNQITDEDHEDIGSNLLIKSKDIKNKDILFENITTLQTPKFGIHCAKKLRGRKRLNPDTNEQNNINNYNDNLLHSKFSDDNIMKKIKARISEYLIEKLNESLRNKSYQFLKFDTELSEYLKKDFNLKLLERTISDIVLNTKIQKRYKNKNDCNKILLDKIIKENREIKTINLLNLKFIDFIDYIRSNNDNLEDFLEKIKTKEKNNKDLDLDKYMQKLEQLFFNYEEWFKNKNGRNTKKEIEN